MTKREAKARKIAWNKALAEYRVVNFNQGAMFREYPTHELAVLAVEHASYSGIAAFIVEPNV